MVMMLAVLFSAGALSSCGTYAAELCGGLNSFRQAYRTSKRIGKPFTIIILVTPFYKTSEYF